MTPNPLLADESVDTLAVPHSPQTTDEGAQLIAPQAPNPLLEGVDPADSHDSNPLLQGVDEPPTPTAPKNFLDRALEALVVEPLRDVSAAVKTMFTTGEAGLRERTPAFHHDPESQMRRGLENTVLGPPTPESEEQRQRALRGLALIGSFAAAPLAEVVLPIVAGPVTAAASRFVRPGPLLGKWGSFLTGEFLGGGLYGTIRPLDPDESRTSAVLGDAALFASAGGIFKSGTELTSRALKRHILSLPPAKRKAAIATAKAELDRVNADLATGGVTISDLPPDVAQKIEEPILRAAVEQADPNAINIDEIINKEANRAVEPNPRLDAKSPAIPSAEVPVEQAFQTELDKTAASPNAVTDAAAKLSDAELAAQPHGATPPLAESAAGPAARQPTERRVAEHPVDIERRRGVTTAGEEYITGVAIRGTSGKVYHGGNMSGGAAIHPELMNEILAAGLKSELEKGVDFGFRTNKREFVSREEASNIADAYAGMKPRNILELDAYSLMAVEGRPGLVPIDSPPSANASLDATAKAAAQPTRSDLSNGRFSAALESLQERSSDETLSAQAVDELLKAQGNSAKTVGQLRIWLERKIAESAAIRQAERAIKEAALMNASVDHAVATINPVEASAPEVKAAKTIVDQVVGSAKERAAESQFSLGAADTRSHAPLTTYPILRNGEEVGVVRVYRKKGEPGTLGVQWIGEREAQKQLVDPLSIGAGNLRGLFDKILADFPGVTKIEGERMTGIHARTPTGVAPIITTDVVNRNIPKQAALEPHPLPGTAKTKAQKARAEKQSAALARALAREGSASDEGVVLELTSEPTGGKLASAKTSASESLAKSLEREEPLISIEPGEQIAAPWVQDAEKIVTPKDMSGLEIGAHLSDSALEDLKQQFLRMARDQTGAISARQLLFLAGGSIEGVGLADDNLPPSAKTGLRALGAFMMLAAVSPRLAEYFKTTDRTRKFLLQYNPAVVMASREKNLFKKYVEAMTTSRYDAIALRDAITKVVPDKNIHRAFMFVAEEGPTAPEWHLLSPSQQQAALVLNQLELRRGILLKQEGVLDEYQQNYVRHLLPEGSFERWRTTGYRVVPTGGAFTQPRKLLKLRDLEAWAQAQGVEGPIMNPSAVYAYHSQEADRALAVVRLQRALERVGLINDFVPGKPLPAGWRPFGILGMQKQMGPEAVASAIENISDPKASTSALVNSLDTVKGYWMRSIMAWPWEHGLNVLRSLPAVASNPVAFGDYWKAVKLRDPGLREATTFGADIFSRPDYGIRAHDGWQRLASIVNLPKVGAAVDRKFEMMDRWLWEQVVPSLQYFAYSQRMHQWAERTGGKFLPHTPEYQTAGRAAADFSNTVAGRIPQELINPKLARMMRLAMFSPQWTTTRIALMTHAAGELGEIAAGRLDPRDAAYLPFKMRQIAWGVAITWLGSKLMSGEEPQFSPNNSKFYMQTGLRNAKGSKIGLDVIGWWETDLQVFNHPFNFIFNRLNPVVKLAGETISGRDYLGRPMTTGQTVGNILSSFGAGAAAIVAPVSMAARALQGRPYTGGELLQDASQASGAFNVATLPRPIDAALAKFAKRLLLRQGIPANSDNIFQLSRIMRGNLTTGHNLVDGQVIGFLSYYKRAQRIGHPIGSLVTGGPPGADELWQEARRVLAEF